MTLIHPFTGNAKDHVDLQFWDMIWGGPEYIDTGKALVAQFNQATRRSSSMTKTRSCRSTT